MVTHYRNMSENLPIRPTANSRYRVQTAIVIDDNILDFLQSPLNTGLGDKNNVQLATYSPDTQPLDPHDKSPATSAPESKQQSERDSKLRTIREESTSDLGASQPELKFPPFTRRTADNTAPTQIGPWTSASPPKTEKIHNAQKTKRRLMNRLQNLQFYTNDLKRSFDEVMATVSPTYEEHVSGSAARQKKGKISNKFYLR